ncbi:MAG: hypothetical protein ACI4SH_04370 [Candidatus Scatosoma sp.]
MLSAFCLAWFCLAWFCGCAKQSSDLFSCVSELRDNVLFAEAGAGGENAFRLCVYSYLREQPLLSDGAAGKTERVAEFYFTAKDGSDTYVLRYALPDGSKEGGGEMSYDDVQRRYYYFCSEDLSSVSALNVAVKNAKTGEEISFCATGAKKDGTLSPREILSAFENAESEKISSMKKDGVFCGEIRIRLIISEEKPYYYLGLIDGNGKTFSYLLDGETGRILAKRESDDA